MDRHVNLMIEKYGDELPVPLPSKEVLASDYRFAVDLIASNPSHYQAGRLTVARDRIAQARRSFDFPTDLAA